MQDINIRKKSKKGSEKINIWFLKFGCDFAHRLLAVGDGGCKTHVYDMYVEEPSMITGPACVLSHPKCVSTVRVTALSYDGNIVITTCDDGTVFRWDRVTNKPTHPAGAQS
jgi:polycomb protein EED